ncbi:hypothetical protein [Janthinobacterium sp.]|uniref:hypothetical protein n=1 Tax=Janthinobacterium sp. TaxID=1871054 RepID=UPI0025877C86|nr:hypothetical protein [Janthinobacterium sp.]MCX7291907.1 hypothetical protein [Janthinobacterium sp.]
MTKFVRIHIDLEHLGTEILVLVPDLGNGANNLPGAIFFTLWKTINGKAFATAVVADITLPHAVLPPNIALGTSVFAAGRAGLELVRIALARTGLPKSALDQIGIGHVSVQSASITYILPFAHAEQASNFKKLIRQHVLLLGLQIMPSHADSQSQYRAAPGSTFAGEDQSNTDFLGVTVSVDFRPNTNFVCIDVTLDENYLQRYDWAELSNWDAGYAGNRYKHIFDRAVRGILRLDGPLAQHPEPSNAALAQLGPRNEQLLREYLTGKDPKMFSGFPFRPPDLESSRRKGWRTAQKVILEQTGIDIKKPWKEYQWQRPDLLVKQLIYPGDYLPKSRDVPFRFCADNWPVLLDSLRSEYDNI